MSATFKPLNERDGNQPGATRYADFAAKVVLGGVVPVEAVVDFEDVARFRYRVVRVGLVWALQRHDKKTSRGTLVSWYWTHRGAQHAARLVNRCSDLAAEEGLL